MRRALSIAATLVALLALGAGAQGPASPSIDDVIGLKRAGAPALSPDGRLVAFTIRETNWDENAYETEIWVAESSGGEPRQLTNAKGSSQQPAWSPDGKRLAFVSDRSGKRQLFVISMAGGEGEAVTTVDDGVTAFQWSPDGSSIALTMLDSMSDEMKAREKQWGDVRLEDEDQRYAHLHVLDLSTKGVRRLTSGQFVVGVFDWSPDGRTIAYDHRTTSDPADGGSADISIVTVATGAVASVVSQPGPDSTPRFSPDGTRLAFVSAMAKPFYFYQNSVIAVVAPGGGRVESLTDTFDENPGLIAWTAAGIHFSASHRTYTALYTIDPGTRATTRHVPHDTWIGSQFSFARDGSTVAFASSGPETLGDVHVGSRTALASARRLSDTNAQLAAWPRHAREVIRWKSQDGTEIEGVLHKPAGFVTGRRYPLLIVIHGGPTGISRPQPYASASFYPIDGFLARGALVLEPNYRGSAGYGEKFRSLNVRNLGIGDAWDVLSGIDHLIALGLVDRDRVGSMGWSQGGYISAFLTTKHADRFRAISVGAGISDWMTYYVNTDIHPFTRQYLKATPWDDPKIYADTSPMTYIKQARTPTLIQHGDQDARVPIPNAFQLYQGLRDQNVPVRLSVFKGFGHGLNKPKANRAAMEQNWEWFGKHIWGAGTESR
jgi:dipeptidyl aminopeptidase/acylaminoacyl peptidase